MRTNIDRLLADESDAIGILLEREQALRPPVPYSLLVAKVDLHWPNAESS